jgi:ACS family tartrate transporter-like MFS transporter
LGDTTCTYGVGLWLPSLIRSVSGVSNLIIGLLSAIPYVFTAIAMVLVGTHSDRTRERRWHLAGAAFVGALGLACAAYSTSTVATIIFLSVTLLAAYSLLGPFWATSTELLSQTSAVAGIALINSFGNLGGFLGPYTIGMMRTWTGSFRGGLLAVAVLLGISGVMALLVFGKVMRRVPLAAAP